ncbi:MAG: tRNA (adenosine(37)-N6)-threonylcarbamoyltransferase complex dimerization subunit type 1 TsaB [Thiobacillaceae bacterium]
MKFLSLDTSTEYCSAALWLDGDIHASRVLAGQTHSSLLLPMVDGLLADAGLSLRQLDGIAYGAGPGSFTGLRIACAVTQGLALGADLPVVGISTLESIAQQTDAARVLTVLDARMAEVYWAAYERAASGWYCVLEPVLSAPELVGVPDAREWMGVGNGFAALGAILLPRLRLSHVQAEVMPDAAAIAALAAPVFARGEGIDAALAAPVYLRDKVAMTIDERRLKKLASAV